MKKATLLTLIALATLFVGCCSKYQHHVTGPGADEVEINDARTYVQDGRTMAQITLTNDDDEAMTMRYRISWRNAVGMQVSDGNPAAGWQTVTFMPFERKDITKIAPMDGCTDFLFYLDEPED